MSEHNHMTVGEALSCHERLARAGRAVQDDGLPTVEELAEIEHLQWIEWASTLLATEPGISDDRRERWQRLIATPYRALTEAEKHSDRIYAEKVLAVIRAAPPLHDPQELER